MTAANQALVAGPLAFVALLTMAACNKAPAEPGGTGSTAAPASTVAPLAWDPPTGWAKLDVGSGPAKARYRVPPSGGDKEDGELGVFYFGTGSMGDPAAAFKSWFQSFDGDVGPSATRESFDAHGLKVDTVEVAGTYKVALAPKPRGRKSSPAQMVKSNWRLYGGVVKTSDRGNWFFRLVGPNDTVQAARSQVRAMMESAH